MTAAPARGCPAARVEARGRPAGPVRPVSPPAVPEDSPLAALCAFGAALTDRFAAAVPGDPEAQLTGPVERLLRALLPADLGPVSLTPETRAPGLGRPDFAAHKRGLLFGHVELKAPGKGVKPGKAWTKHDRDQFERFGNFPNLLYADGNRWALYRDGERVGRVVTLPGDVREDGPEAADEQTADRLARLVAQFCDWDPEIPQTGGRLAATLAKRCRLLRDEVRDAVGRPASVLNRLAAEWRGLLFPDADDDRFADGYAQTVTFALLLARAEGVGTLDLTDAVRTLAAEHTLISRALEVLTDRRARTEIAVALETLQRIVHAVDPAALNEPDPGADGAGHKPDPWLYFYEDFLAAYDPGLRRDYGVYYTPVEVVRAQVRWLDELLRARLGKPAGFAEDGVLTLDPAVGTGTYLLGVIDHALARVERDEGTGAVAGRAAQLAENLYAFEWMVGPYAVAELRLSQEFRRRGAELPPEGPNVYLTNTLESPYATAMTAGLFQEPLALEHARALHVKRREDVLVCLGNPPYDRHESVDSNADAGTTGGWVRHGGTDEPDPILEAILKPARDAGHGVHLKNLYNLYVYFWRWALWKVFEFDPSRAHSADAAAPGLVSFITASSYLTGDAFVGLRELMRRECDEVFVLDLGGEGRGTRKEQNVFAIQTPVCVALAARYGPPDREKPAAVKYHRLRYEKRADKLHALGNLGSLADVPWEDCPDGWHDPFTPAGTGAYFECPLLTDLFPWQHSGSEVKRIWPIAPDRGTLKERWEALLTSENRAAALKETRDRKVDKKPPAVPGITSGEPIADLPPDERCPQIVRYGYRGFDRHSLIGDSRVADYVRPQLWLTASGNQVFLTSLFNHRLGHGPALTATAHVPDRHHFRGSYGGKDVVPLYRDADAAKPNVAPGLLDRLGETYAGPVTAEDLFAYAYALLAQPAYTERFWDELETCEVRVPLTADAATFREAADRGGRLLWLHTYGERFTAHADPAGFPTGVARCTAAVPPTPLPDRFEYDPEGRTLHVGDGAFAPVSPAVWAFEVSGLKVLRSWLDNRSANPGGRTSSPLDAIRPARWTAEFTAELLRLLAILEATVVGYDSQSALLDRVLAGPLIPAADLPPVPAAARKPPKVPKPDRQRAMFDAPDD